MAENRLYISKRLGIAILLIFIVSFIAFGAGIFFLFTKSSLTNPADEYKPLESIGLPKKEEPVSGKVAAAEVSKASPKLTIVFFYDGYDEQNSALGAIEVMKEALNLVEPYKSQKDAIDIKVFTTDGKKCKVDEKAKMLVCNKELIESFRKLGTDRFKVVLLSPLDFSSTAPLAYGKNSWISISTNLKGQDPATYKRTLGFQFINLLGHALGLKYEYTDEKNIPEFPTAPAGTVVDVQKLVGRPNCAPDLATAQEWWGDYVAVYPDKIGFYTGCGWNKDAYYPQQKTLMSDAPAEESYGIVSEDYLRGVLTCFYGKGQEIVLPAQNTASESARIASSCTEFVKNYPSFWTE